MRISFPDYQHATLESAVALLAAEHPPKTFRAVEGATHVILHTCAKGDYEGRIAALRGLFWGPAMMGNEIFSGETMGYLSRAIRSAIFEDELALGLKKPDSGEGVKSWPT
jgi:hypothetical protein